MLFEERRGHLVGQIVVRVNFRRPCDLQNNPCTQFVIRFLFHFSVFFDVRVDFEHGVVPLVGTSTAVQMLSQDLVIKSFDSRLFGARIGGIVTPIQVRKQDFYLVDVIVYYSASEGVSIVLMSASVAASEPALRNIAERGAFSSLSVIAQPDRVSSLYFSHDPADSVRPLKSPAIW